MPVEATHRHSGFPEAFHAVEHGCATGRIRSRNQQSLGFVEKDVLIRIGELDELAVDVNGVGLWAHGHPRGADDLAANPHDSGFDEFVTLAPRGDARAG